MNLNLIDAMLPLLSPAARKYLGEIRSGRRPVVLPEGVSDVPDGLTVAGTRALHRIAQTQDPTKINISNIVNSGILIRRLNQKDMQNPNLPRSDRELFDRLYAIRGGETVRPAGPLEQGPQQPPMQPQAAAPQRQAPASDNRMSPSGIVTNAPTGMLSSQDMQELSRVLSPVAIQYLRTGEYPKRATFGGEFLSAGQRKILDQLKTDPSKVTGAQLLTVARTGDIPGVTGAADAGLMTNYLNRITQRSAAGAEQSAASLAAARTPTPDSPPNAPLPQGFVYQYDYQRNLWVVADQRSGNRFVRFVNQLGETVDASGNVTGPPEAGGVERGGPQAAAAAGAAPVDPLGRGAGTAGFGRGGQVSQTQGAGVDTSTLAGVTAASGQTATTVEPGGGQGMTGPVGGPGAGGGVGGGFGGGMAGVPGADTGMVDTGVPTDWEAAAAELYPEYYAIVKNNPEIARLLTESISQGWSEARFQAELRGTNWWKTTTASARQWDAASALDPATYQARVDEAATNINQQALALGVRLSDESLQKLALDSQRLGWGDQTIINAIGMRALEGGTAGATQLRDGYYGQEIRKIARQYGVTLNDTTFNSFVNRIAVGDESLNSFQDYALTIAKSLYPPLANQFDAGRTFEDVVSPYKQVAASILEKSDLEIDFMDPMWNIAVTYMPDPKTGEQRLMNLREWGDLLRTDRKYGYEYTTQAREKAYAVTEQLANLFGRV